MKDDTGDVVSLHGTEWKIAEIGDQVEACRKHEWRKERWQPAGALVDKRSGTRTRYRGQKYDPDKVELDQDAWTHDHCEICWWTICRSDEPVQGEGYTDGAGDWLCTECFESLVDQMPSRDR